MQFIFLANFEIIFPTSFYLILSAPFGLIRCHIFVRRSDISLKWRLSEFWLHNVEKYRRKIHCFIFIADLERTFVLISGSIWNAVNVITVLETVSACALNISSGNEHTILYNTLWCSVLYDSAWICVHANISTLGEFPILFLEIYVHVSYYLLSFMTYFCSC